MTKRFISWLCFLTVCMFLVQSCVHDEISSSADPASKEYHSKSLWKEDEKYIKNVMQVYFENETKIKKSSGEPFWDYAVTMETFDESFLMVPVVDGERVVSVLQVPRIGSMIHFYNTQFPEHISFFQDLVFAKTKKAILPDNPYASKASTCSSIHISVWIPNNPNNDSGSGHWETKVIVRCTRQDIDACTGIVGPGGECSDGGGGDGYPYPGGGGNNNNNPQPETPEDPCQKGKNTFNNTAVKSRYEALKGKVSDPKETGYGFKTVTGPGGQPTTQTNPLNPDATSADKMNVGIYPTTFGYSHTHINKNDGNVTVKIFSPADINTFLIILRNAIANNVPLDTVFGGMVASDPDKIYNTYQIQYTGNGANLPAEFTEQQLDTLKIWYTKKAQQIQTETGELSHTDLQKLFNETLKKMNLNDVVLFKMEGSSNTVKKVDYDTYGSPTENNCS